MGRLQIMICDDDVYAHDMMEEKLKFFCKERGIAYDLMHVYSGEELLEYPGRYDLLFLDIDMSPGMDGIRTGLEIKREREEYKIIMLTNQKHRMKEAFRLNVIYFLEKPVKDFEFVEAMEDYLSYRIGHGELEILIGNAKVMISEREIVYAFSKGGYLKLELKNREGRFWGTVADFTKKLDPKLFCRCHRSYIVNLQHVKSCRKNSLIMVNGKEIPVSRDLHAEVEQRVYAFESRYKGRLI